MVMETVQDQFPAGLRVLVVDDDPTCLFILERMLQRCFYNVTTCGQAAIALAMLRQNKRRFDLVISDVHMPDMDGFRLLELIGLEMNIPVIMMSVDGEFSVVLKGIIHGACDYLLKPVRIEALRNIWQHVIRKKQLKGREVEQGDSEDIDRSKRGSENLELAKKRKDIKDNELDTEDQSTLKKQRVVWSRQLHEQFVSAVNHLGIEKAVPKRILEMMNVQGLTRENVASHLQKYRLYLKRLNYEQNHALDLHYAELNGHSSCPPFWIGPGEFLMPARSNELSPKAFTVAHSGFANGLSFPNNPGLVRVDPLRGYVQTSAVEEVHGSPPSQVFSNAAAGTLEDESPNPNRSAPIQIMPTISSGQAPNSSLSDLITDLSQQLQQQNQRCSLQPATEKSEVPNRYSMTLAESASKRSNPSCGGISKEYFCQRVDPLGPAFGGDLTEMAFEGLPKLIIPIGKENFEYPSESSTKTMGISKSNSNSFANVTDLPDSLNANLSLSPSLLKTLHSGLESRMDAQNSESATKTRVDTQKYEARNIKLDWETQAPSLWQGADTRSTSGPFACSTQVSTRNNVASRILDNLEIVHGLDGLGLDASKKDNDVLLRHGKLQAEFEHATAHANMKSNEGHEAFTSGIKEKKESGNILLAPFLSDDLLNILLKEENCLQHQKLVFSEHEIPIEGFSKGSLYVN